MESNQRKSLNLRIDPEKYVLLEKMRVTGFGYAQTERNRSDVYNEIIGYGIQTTMLKNSVGEREFEKLWQLVNKIDWKKIPIEKIEKFLS